MTKSKPITSPTCRRFAARLVLGLLIASFPFIGRAASTQFQADCQAMTQAPHRLSGTPAGAAAQEYVTQRLRAITGQDPFIQPFPVLRMTTKRCELVLTKTGGDSQTLRLYPARPNNMIPPTTSADGLTGHLLYAGTGEPAAYGTHSPAGKIVILDADVEAAWLRAFRLGAKAVIFLASAETSRSPKCLAAPVNLPRFYYPGQRQDLPDGASATIHSEIIWEQAVGRNVLTLIPGNDPTFALDKRELIIISAPLDTYGEFPDLTPGGRNAANCAALLKIADYLKGHPPRRDILVAFFDGQAQGHAGVSAFYRALDTDEHLLQLTRRQAGLQQEKQFIQAMLDTLRDSSALTEFSVVRTRVLRRLMNKAADQAFTVKMRWEDMNRVITRLKKQSKQTPRATSDAQTLAHYQKQLQSLQQAKDNWNSLRRVLSRNDIAEAVTAYPAEWNLITQQVQGDIQARQHELAEAETALTADTAIQQAFSNVWIVLHTALLLGDTTPRWGLVIGGDSIFHSPKNQPGLYNKIQSTFLEANAVLTQKDTPLSLLATATADGSSAGRFFAGGLVHSGEIAGLYGIYNLVFGTVQETCLREGFSDDTLDRLNLDRLEAQADEIGRLLAEVGNQEGLSLNRTIVRTRVYAWPQWTSGNQAQGPTVMGQNPGSSMPNVPMTHAVVSLTPPLSVASTIVAFNNFVMTMTDANAMYGYGPLPSAKGMVGYAFTLDECGAVETASSAASMATHTTRLNVFPCADHSWLQGTGTVSRRYGVALLPPQALNPPPKLAETKVMNAISDSMLNKAKTLYDTTEQVVFWYCDRTIEAVKLFGQMIVLLDAEAAFHDPTAAGSTEQAPTSPYGRGLSLLRPWRLPATAFHCGADLWRLNQYRLNLLRERGIMNTSADELHARAEDLLKAANALPQVAASEALAASAFLAEIPVYHLTRRSLNDLAKAVLILLALAIPFAFAVERLLIGSTNIYRQIAWFCAFFLAVFILIYFVHPAFAISQQPIIIFLAFTLMLLSSFVIFIIMRKFEDELKMLQGLASTVHMADVSRFSTMMAAMSMGISTMRRRPLRTALTALTIMLLTFTILNFASFDMRIGVVPIFQGPSPSFSGVSIHHVNWDPLRKDLLDLLKGRWSQTATVTARHWMTPSITGPNKLSALLTIRDGRHPVVLRGLLGLDPAEIRQRADWRAFFGAATNFPADGILLSKTLAHSMALQVGDEVLLHGRVLRLAHIFDADQALALKDMDGSDILPVDFSSLTDDQTRAIRKLTEYDLGTATLAAAQSKQDWVVLPADLIAIISNETARQLGATLQAVNLYTKNAGTATALAMDLARILPLPVSATCRDGIYTHVLAPTVTAKGVKDLFFPIVLGGLVIFGTMLGSVSDREKEIYTFSALGLAPVHVTTLFFAEALVYSFIGGLGGYLLAQGVIKLMILLYNLGLLRSIPEMNYSSLNAIITILIVMGTVLASAIYPAYKASRSANPGIMRTWRLPKPEGDRFNIVFPFTVSDYDILGVMSFLKEHFDNFSDTSLGVFMARDTVLTRAANNALGLRAALILAPFDLGVTQDFQLTSVASEIPGIDEVKIEITRQSGQQNDWIRSNKVLLDDLRRQFLIWRSLPHETMEHYRQRTLVAIGAAGSARPATTQKGKEEQET